MITRFTFAGVALLSLTSCASAPTAEELALADFGAPISQEDAERAASEVLHTYLKDPNSAKIDWAPVGPGWIREVRTQGGGRRFGYFLNARVNAKHRFGGYTGYRPYMFLFRDGVLVSAYAEHSPGLSITVMRKIR